MYKIKFYLILIGELFLSPYLYFKNFWKWNFKTCQNRQELIDRNNADSNRISVCIHEWGGYKAERRKKLKVAKEFTCGLKFQLERYKNYNGNRKLDVLVTISDAWRVNEDLKNIKVLEVGNDGMDFSGYSAFFEIIQNAENHYVILSNTSVNKAQVQFLDSYIEYMENNKAVGLLGISYSTKMYQSIIRNNFTPHAQSFFLLTTLDVLKQIVKLNGGFPGQGITEKRLLIRMGEVQLSKIVLKLGYEIALVLESGDVFKFDESFLLDNGRSKWSIPMGDYRAFAKNPNAINVIKNTNFVNN